MRQHASMRGRPLARLAVGVAVPAVALAVGATVVHADVRPTRASDTATLTAAGAIPATTQPPAAAPAVGAPAPADPAAAGQGANPSTATTPSGAGQPAPEAIAADAAAATPAADPPGGVPATTAAPPATTTATDRAPVALTPPGAKQAVATPANANANCTLVVPANPLTAQGLSTPYQLVATNTADGPCVETNQDQSAFVQAAVITKQGRLTLYNPLVVTQGKAPAAPPVRAFVPLGSTVGIWFGFNGDVLTLSSGDAGALQTCKNGTPGSPFGQFAHCNAPEFFRAANAAITAGRLKVPRLGTARDKLPCPTVRDFSVVDQDQSDNVNTHYLATADGLTAQPGASARLRRKGTDLANGSDNRLLTEFILPTLGCRSFTRPDQSNGGRLTASLPLQELQAAARQGAPVALVPLNDPMTTENGKQSSTKTDLFRAGVNQLPLGTGDNGDPTAYCQRLYEDKAGIARVFAARKIFAKGPSANPAGASNLFTFLAARAFAAYPILGCHLKNGNPITLTKSGAMVTDASFAKAPAAAGQAGAAQANAAQANAGQAPAADGQPADPAAAANPAPPADPAAAANPAPPADPAAAANPAAPADPAPPADPAVPTDPAATASTDPATADSGTVPPPQDGANPGLQPAAAA